MAKSKFDWDFETLGDPQLVKMLDAAKQFCSDMINHRPAYWLSLLGTSGAGKTHLAKKINVFFQRFVEGSLIPDQPTEPPSKATYYRCTGGLRSWRSIVAELRSGEFTGFQRNLCHDYFVGLDDIGAEHETRFVVSKLDELCDARLKKWTVLTANLPLQQISEKLDVRIASRMMRNDSVVVDVDVTDFNLRRKAA